MLKLPLLPFSFADPWGIVLALAIAAAAFLIMRTLTRDIQTDEIEIFVMVNVTMAFSVALLFAYRRYDEISRNDLYLTVGLIAAYYVAVFISAKMLGMKKLKLAAKPVAQNVIASDPARNLALIVSFAIGFPALLAISLASLRAGLNAQYGVLRESGPLRLLLEGGIPIFLYYAFASNIVSRKFLNPVMIAMVLIAAPLGGAKSAVISYLLVFLTVRGTSGKNSHSEPC